MTMKPGNILFITGLLLTFGSLFSCQDSWNEHYEKSELKSEEFEIWSGDIESYVKSQNDLTLISSLFENQGIYDSTSNQKGYTYIVYDNSILNGVNIQNDSVFAKNCVSDVSIAPSKLKEGFGIFTRLGKNIWIYEKNGQLYFDDYKLVKRVRTDNGYIYHVDGIIPIRKSVYEQLKSLGNDYSIFLSLVERHEEIFFDKELSKPIGIDKMGNTTYDSVMSIRNSLMDRFTKEGLKLWDMRSEDYLTTMFIPSNELIINAIESAMDSIPIWLGRDATVDDRRKFENWIVRACFVNDRLSSPEISESGSDFCCVGGYQLVIDKTQDVAKYLEIDAANWRPSVQKVSDIEGLTLSNGVAYYLNHLKIPNHVVIYRVKSKFYELWGAMTDAKKEKHFRWKNWIEPMIVNDAQSLFTLSETLPTMYYHVLTAIPSSEAIADSLVCSVNYDGLLYNQTTRRLTEVYLPAGEYYLRMGFKHSLRYSIDISFNDSLLVEDMLLYAQGSNFHFDRGSVSVMDYFGSSSIGYPEGFDWRDWIEKNEKAVAYDTDGYQIAVVTLRKSGNFSITIDSKDDSYLYDPANGRTKNNVTQLMMYHWCLRPTGNNY